jgi:ABC-type transport system involved in multi-copper enzyme maturation permease subunit
MGFFSVLLRLIGMELYKIRRRLMSKVLGSLVVLLAVLASLAVWVDLAIVPDCNAQGMVAESGTACVTLNATQMAQWQQATSEPLRLPSSLELAVTQDEFNPGIILVIILVGSIAGGELSIGTVRLMFTRGPWRGQFLLAKYGASLVCVVLGVLTMAVIGVLTGQVINLFSGGHQSFAFFNGAWLGHACLYLLATMLHWFMYAVVAIFFALLGRSTVAGVVGALTWFFAEPILSNILAIVGNFSLGVFSTFFRLLPSYFMGNNARALQLNQAHYLFGSAGSSESDLQAMITLVIYLAAFIGLTWWLNESRDVTN